MVDDYAHHPTEIAATLTAAKQGDHRRVIAVFQPHLFSRTRYLQREFGQALTLADEAIVTDIFPAREEPEPGVTGKLIVDAYLAERPGGPVVLPAAARRRGRDTSRRGCAPATWCSRSAPATCSAPASRCSPRLPGKGRAARRRMTSQ